MLDSIGRHYDGEVRFARDGLTLRLGDDAGGDDEANGDEN
jgi:hypothetical protein